MANAFNKAIEEEAERADTNRNKATAIDPLIERGPDFTQLPKLGEKDAATDEGGVNAAVAATAP